MRTQDPVQEMAMKRTVTAKARTPNPSSDRPRVRATDPARESAQEGGSNSTEVHETTQAAVRETNREIEQTYSTLAKSAADLSLQWIETVRVSTNFALDFSRELIGVK